MTWFDTSDSPNGWNLTASAIDFTDTLSWTYVTPPEDVDNDETDDTEPEMPTIMFQTAFPFIGLADQTWAVLTEAL